MNAMRFCSPYGLKQTRHATLIAILCMSAGASLAQTSGFYKIQPNQPQQVIKGLGFEIQSDSIGSGNAGMPDDVIAVPHDLTPSEKTRFYTEMLHGFRYARLAMGLYLRGNDAEKKQIIERYSGQMDDLRTMQQVSGLEGFDVEYWSPAPYWKANKTYYGGTIAGSDPAFVNAFTDALAEDLRYLQGHGLRIAQWGLQNEPAIGHLQQTPGAGRSGDANQSYSNCSAGATGPPTPPARLVHSGPTTPRPCRGARRTSRPPPSPSRRRGRSASRRTRAARMLRRRC